MVLLAPHAAHAVVSTVAVARLGAMHRFLAEYDCPVLATRRQQLAAELTMPRIFQHPTAQVILQPRIHQPLPIPHIIPLRPRPDRLPAGGKLRAARHADLLGDGQAREQLLEGGLVDVLCVDGLGGARGRRLVGHGVDLGGAAEDPGAAQVHIAGLLETVEAEAREQREGVVVRVVVVPLETFGVVKDDVAGEGVVAVDDVAVEG